MNRFGKKPELFPLHRLESALSPDFKPTDKQFDIGRAVAGQTLGLDLIRPKTGERLYITQDSSREAEEKIARKVGHILVPKTKLPGVLVNVNANIQVYEVPNGARSLMRTLRQSPYRRRYMERLSERAANLLQDVYQLDSNSFGLTLDALAIGHNGSEDDDATLFLVPPFAEPNRSVSQPTAGLEIINERELSEISPPLREVFHRVLLKGVHDEN
jgi:hypothetical protein